MVLQANLQPGQAVQTLNDRVKRINKINIEIADWLQVCASTLRPYVPPGRSWTRYPINLTNAIGCRSAVALKSNMSWACASWPSPGLPIRTQSLGTSSFNFLRANVHSTTIICVGQNSVMRRVHRANRSPIAASSRVHGPVLSMPLSASRSRTMPSLNASNRTSSSHSALISSDPTTRTCITSPATWAPWPKISTTRKTSPTS